MPVYVGTWVCAQEGGCLGREAEVIRFHEGGGLQAVVSEPLRMLGTERYTL